MISYQVNESSYEMTDWMLFDLGLDIEGVFVYAIVYDFSRDDKACPYDLKLIALNSNLNQSEVENAIKMMLKKGILEAVLSDSGETIGLVHSKTYLSRRGIEEE